MSEGRFRSLSEGFSVRRRGGRSFLLAATLAAVAVLSAACTSSPTAAPTSTSSSTSTTHSSTSTTQSGPSNCSTSQVQVSAGTSNGAAGTIGQVILFKNTSATTCLLHGFPGVAGLDNAGNQIAQASRVVNLAPFSGSTATLPTVTLTTGVSASALVFGSDVPTGNATSCIQYAALLVTPPNAAQSVRVAATLPGCAGLRVGPVYAGTTGMPS